MRHYINYLLAMLVAMTYLTHINVHRVFALNSNNQSIYSETEEWVLEKILQGESADLSQTFNGDNRNLSADFLRSLLSDPAIVDQIPRQGVTIYNAEFIDPIDLNNMEIHHEISLINSRFKNEVDLGDSHFLKDLNLINSIFENKVSFFQMQVEGDFYLNSTIFKNEVSLYQIDVGGDLLMDSATLEKEGDFNQSFIGGNFYAIETIFQDLESEVDFRDMTVGKTANFRGAVFNGSADFTYANVGKRLILDSAHFLKSASFNSLRVGTNAFCYDTIFDGNVNFIGASFGTSLILTSAKFNNSDGENQFDYLKTGQSLYLWDTVFEGGVDFSSIEIKEDIFADGVKFKNTELQVDFSGINSRFVRLSNAEFFGPVYFNGSNITYNFVSEDSQYNNPEYGPQFDDVKVGNTIYLGNSIFFGYTDFGGLIIGGDFDADNAVFKYPDTSLALRQANVRGAAYLRDTEILGGVSFRDSTITDVYLSGSDNGILTIDTINVEHLNIEREFQLENVSVNTLLASELNVLGLAQFNNLEIKDSADLENSSFNKLNIGIVLWPPEKENFRLGGLSYNRFTFEDSPTLGWQKILTVINNATYEGQLYSDLENYISLEGNQEAADKIYIQQRRREREEFLRQSSVDWWWNTFLDVFVQYGRKPGLAFFWSFLFVLFGTYVFRKENMTYINENNESNRILETYGRKYRYRKAIIKVAKNRKQYKYSPPYNPFWYSLDIFLPVVDLINAKDWMPKPNKRFATHYQKVHVIIGWILVTVGVLAITGLIG